MSYNEKGPSSSYPTLPFVSSVPPSYHDEKVPSPGMNGGRNNNISEKAESMFKSNSWRDLWAAILYYIHLAGVAVILGLNASNLMKLDDGTTYKFNSVVFKLLACIGGSLLVSLVFLAIFLSLVSHFPESMIKGTFVATIAFMSLLGIGMMVKGAIIIGIIYFFIAGINVFLYFSWRKRIPFSAVLLKTVIDVMKIYPSTWNLSLVAIFGQTAFLALYLITSMAIILKYPLSESGDLPPMEPFDKFSLVYIVFSMYWSNQVVDNVVHTTVCGVFGTFYFLHGTGVAIVKPVWNSFARSMTYSFGSIAFGSLIVAIIQLIRFLINSTRNERDNAAAACADCLLNMIEDLVKYFNYYAYVHVAIYGKPYIESGKDTWALVKSHGVDVIINDCLIDKCMGVGIFLISILSATITYIVGVLMSGLHMGHVILVTAVSFIVSLLVCSVATQLIGSGSSATLVCYAEDPSALERSKPELYREITTAYRGGFF